MYIKFFRSRITGYLAAFCSMICLVLSVSPVKLQAQEENQEAVVQEIEGAMEQILEWQCGQYGVSDVRELLDLGYSGNALSGVVQSYILGLRGYEDAYAQYDFKAYIKALQEALQCPEEVPPSSLQKSAMTLEALGAENPALEACLNDTIGQKGIMTYIYGLLMLDGGTLNSEKISREEIILELLKEQCPDGGFALLAETGDVDVTAMTVQALSPYYQSSAKVSEQCVQQVTEAVDLAMEFLSQQQLSDGDFESYGNPCCESTAQVILALCALDRDPLTEEAFIKDGHTVYDGLMKYRNADGSFLHTLDGLPNDMATSQAFYALSAILRFEHNLCFLFDFASYERTSNTEISETGDFVQGPADIRWILTGIAAAGLICYFIVLMIKKKATIKRLAGAGLAAAILLLLIWFVRIQSRESYLSGESAADRTETIEVSVEIRCDTVAGKKDYIPQDGVILSRTDLSVWEGASAFDVLQEAARLYDIQLEYTGDTLSHGFIYVEGIAYLYEFDFGDLSGWMYQVNDVFPGVGSGEYPVSEGDRILWVYTTDLGKDVGDDGQN